MGSAGHTFNFDRIRELVETATDQRNNGAPGVVFRCVNEHDEELIAASSGVRDLSTSQPMTDDSIFWIASCTKLVTSIAVMQLVERGVLDLDDPDQVSKLVPEVSAARVLSCGEKKPQESKITLRMLLTHTSGYGYTFLWKELWDSLKQDCRLDEFQGSFDAFKQPLKFQPGTEREYSIGIDWAGVMVQRVSGLTLGDYFNENIFKPLGMRDSSMVPESSMYSRLCSMHNRKDTGQLELREHLNKVARHRSSAFFHSGGAGLFSTAIDYCKILAALINGGISSKTSQRILEKSTVDEMFCNQISDWQQKYAGRGHAICRTDLAIAALREDVPAIEREGWGLSFLLSGDNLQVGSAAGISNCFWIMNREKKIGAVLFSQILPLGDPAVLKLWVDLQSIMFS